MFDFLKTKKKKESDKYTGEFNICDDVLHYILSFIDIKELCSQTCLVDKRFKSLVYKHREIYENDMKIRLRSMTPMIGGNHSMYYKAIAETLYCHTMEEIDEKITLYNKEQPTSFVEPWLKAIGLYVIINTANYDKLVADKIRYKYEITLVPHHTENEIYVYRYEIQRNTDIINNIRICSDYEKILYSDNEISNNFMHFPTNQAYDINVIKVYSRSPTINIEFDCVILERMARIFLGNVNEIYNHTTNRMISNGISRPAGLNDMVKLLS